MKKLKQKIAKLLQITEEDVKANNYYHPKLFGEGKTVSYEINGLTDSFCQLTEWTNGEGYDIFFQTKTDTKIGHWEDKRISLHTDEIETLFACLNHFKYFE